MLFSSTIFLLFFLPAFFAIYFAIAPRYRNAFALLGSLIFYTWGAPKFAAVLVVSSAIDFAFAKRFEQSKNRKSLLYLALIQNIGLLFFFKYFNFFEENLAAILHAFGFSFNPWFKVALPLGISFFTFQKISFLVDVYRNEAKPPKSFADYLLFVMLFPQLIAGPILKYKWIEKQLQFRHVGASWNERFQGFNRFVVGLSKKLLIADQLVPLVNSGFSENALEGSQWLCLIAYTMQLYFDFSGYSDMAIGLGKMMDFSFPENFNLPYKSKSIREFWRRWHMTLGQWMRDYLYIPLGGNRASVNRHYLNLLLVFALSGLWHGASFNFLIWGLWHVLFITLETRFLNSKLLSNWLYSTLAVLLGWVWFRADDLQESVSFFQGLFSGFSFGNLTSKTATLLLIALVLSVLPFSVQQKIKSWQKSMSRTAQWTKAFGILVLLTLCLGALATSGTQPFIYFRF